MNVGDAVSNARARMASQETKEYDGSIKARFFWPSIITLERQDLDFINWYRLESELRQTLAFLPTKHPCIFLEACQIAWIVAMRPQSKITRNELETVRCGLIPPVESDLIDYHAYFETFGSYVTLIAQYLKSLDSSILPYSQLNTQSYTFEGETTRLHDLVNILKIQVVLLLEGHRLLSLSEKQSPRSMDEQDYQLGAAQIVREIEKHGAQLIDFMQSRFLLIYSYWVRPHGGTVKARHWYLAGLAQRLQTWFGRFSRYSSRDTVVFPDLHRFNKLAEMIFGMERAYRASKEKTMEYRSSLASFPIPGAYALSHLSNNHDTIPNYEHVTGVTIWMVATAETLASPFYPIFDDESSFNPSTLYAKQDIERSRRRQGNQEAEERTRILAEAWDGADTKANESLSDATKAKKRKDSGYDGEDDLEPQMRHSLSPNKNSGQEEHPPKVSSTKQKVPISLKRSEEIASLQTPEKVDIPRKVKSEEIYSTSSVPSPYTLTAQKLSKEEHHINHPTIASESVKSDEKMTKKNSDPKNGSAEASDERVDLEGTKSDTSGDVSSGTSGTPSLSGDSDPKSGDSGFWNMSSSSIPKENEEVIRGGEHTPISEADLSKDDKSSSSQKDEKERKKKKKVKKTKGSEAEVESEADPNKPKKKKNLFSSIFGSIH